MMFNLHSNRNQKKNDSHTASEIVQQPEVWNQLVEALKSQEGEIKRFIQEIYQNHDNVRVIFTGAGTSAFIGDILVPVLNGKDIGAKFEAIPTTHIVSNPDEYILRDTPTVLVSFARSGNSPESVATVKLAQKLIKEFYHIVITCNKEGQLAKDTQEDSKAITILMPEKSHDKGFAMTSSFTCMMISAYTLFTGQYLSEGMTAESDELIHLISEKVDKVLEFDFTRLVYLGSGMLSQMAHESALKMLELTAGKVVAIHESSLGFRHGPKSILNEQSLVVLFISEDPYTRKYDIDILKELSGDESGLKVVALTSLDDEEISTLADWTIQVPKQEEGFNDDLELSLNYVLFAQILALKKSMSLGIEPDNPSPDGRVNRVVKGVVIHDYK